MTLIRTRWAAIGVAVAVTLGGGGIGLVAATSPADAVTFVPITACRVMDTRPAFQVGPRSAPLGPGDTYTVSAHGDNGDCVGIPASATALSMNVTAVGASAATFLTIWATGIAQPDSSSLNPSPGQPPTPNAVTTNLNASGQFDIFNRFGNVHVLADINGYYVDHGHDDRYYTKAEVDEMTGDLWGYVTSVGTLHATSGGFTVEHPSTGLYCIIFPTRSSHKATQASSANPSASRVVSVGTGHGSGCNPFFTGDVSVVPITVRLTDGTLVDDVFVFHVPTP